MYDPKDPSIPVLRDRVTMSDASNRQRVSQGRGIASRTDSNQKVYRRARGPVEQLVRLLSLPQGAN